MKLKIFQSDKGDSLLISNQGANILVDGGMTNSYTAHVAPYLGKMRDNGEEIDIVCVSHIDDDHIGGILRMVEDEIEWRVTDFHKDNGDPVKQPKSIRPPKIKEFWHNAFNISIGKNTGDIEGMLANTASILNASDDENDIKLGAIAFSVGQAIQLSQRLKTEQLGIALNKRFGGKLVTYKKNQPAISIGGLKISIIAPFPIDLTNLMKAWNKWLKDSKTQLEGIKATVKKAEGMLGNSVNELSYLLALAKGLGDRKKITPPNLASIMFLVEEGQKKVLMTGDGAGQDIMKGLEGMGKLDTTKGLHLNVLKVQHHGAEFNISDEFLKLITADNYVFCGNGFATNPEIEVIDAIIKSRAAGPNKAITAEVNNKFTLWFNSSEALTKKEYKPHMAKVEKFVKAAGAANTKVKFNFMPTGKSFFELTI